MLFANKIYSQCDANKLSGKSFETEVHNKSIGALPGSTQAKMVLNSDKTGVFTTIASFNGKTTRNDFNSKWKIEGNNLIVEYTYADDYETVDYKEEYRCDVPNKKLIHLRDKEQVFSVIN